MTAEDDRRVVRAEERACTPTPPRRRRCWRSIRPWWTSSRRTSSFRRSRSTRCNTGAGAHGVLLHRRRGRSTGRRNPARGAMRASRRPRRANATSTSASARRSRCSRTSRRPSRRCPRGSSRRGHSTLDVPGDIQPGQSPGTVNFECSPAASSTPDFHDRSHTSAARPARRRSDAGAVWAVLHDAARRHGCARHQDRAARSRGRHARLGTAVRR